jgi:adenine-specific DNA-methyltransferase
MKLAKEVTKDKLRGGYYTPDDVVDWCIERAFRILGERSSVQILEPSAGDGAFIRGLKRSPWYTHSTVICIEKCLAEASKCRAVLEASGIRGGVVADSFFNWLAKDNSRFDCVLGNPPFIRYQFVPASDRLHAEQELSTTGENLAGVSNLYIPFVLLSLRRLTPGGAFAMVLPSEVLCTSSGDQVRRAMLQWLDDLRIYLFPRESFPSILQDIAVFSGRKRSTPACEANVTFAEHLQSHIESWTHPVSLSEFKWTKFLLNEHTLEAFGVAARLQDIHVLANVAKFSVSIVTGANSYFAVDKKTVDLHDLHLWAKPLMSRSYDSPGLVFERSDHIVSEVQGRPTWLLDFNPDAPNPELHSGAYKYLVKGEEDGVHARYKCRIRSPWYRVPHVWPGVLMMSKRANLHHRVLLNEALVHTTDTIYRGSMRPEYAGRERDFVACFHNSLTLLSSEIKGRTYGGGVLELVPSEISSLVVPLMHTNGDLKKLDQLSRISGGQRDENEKVVHATNELLCRRIPGYGDLVSILEEGRIRLRRRRFDSAGSSAM